MSQVQTMSETYKFRREDTGEVMSVSFETMMEAKDGMIEVEPGIFAKRIDRPTMKASVGEPGEAVIISDALGFGQQQLAEMRDHNERHNIQGVDFVRDPQTPEFIQVHCSSEKAKQNYMKSRGFTDRNSRNGGGFVLTDKDFDDAIELLSRDQQES